MHTSPLRLPFLGLLLLFGTCALAAEHGFVTSILHAHPEDNLFPVDVEMIDGKNAGYGPNHHAHVGKRTVTVSLVYSDAWGSGMSATQNKIYTKDFDMTVEKGKTYYIAAKVDQQASAEAQRDGSFWNPVVAEVH